MAPAIFHKRALDEIRSFPRRLRKIVGAAIWDLQRGRLLAMPLSRAMPIVASATHELRVHDAQVSYRVIYCLRPNIGVLLLAAFAKQTRAAPKRQIRLAQQRLKELLDE